MTFVSWQQMLFVALFFNALLLFYVVYLLRCAWYWNRIREAAPAEPSKELPLVSVIVPARNEAANVQACVEAILNQVYPSNRFELILVNDHSEDATVEIARASAKAHSNFRILNLATQTGTAYKKAAVAQGIAASHGEIIVTTDADCVMGPHWLQTMVARFEENTGLVSGPVLLEGRSVFGQFQALEFMGLIAVGAASIASGNPTMCNGANLAYRKSAFEEVGGFAGIDHIASGDDELLMHKIAAIPAYSIRFAKDRDAIVRTPAQQNWTAFKQQRIRWVSKSRHYKRSSITFTLVLAYLAMLGFPLMLIGGCFDSRIFILLFASLGLKVFAEAMVLVPAAIFFDKLRLIRWLPLEQVAHIAYVLWVGIAGNRKSYNWKGRNVK